MARHLDDPSGVDVYPKMQVPKVAGFPGGGGASRRAKLKLAGIVAGAAVVGGTTGFLLRPTHSSDLARANTELADAHKSATVEKERADGLDQQLALVKKDKEAVDHEVADLSSKAADVEKRAEKLAAEEKKLSGALDKESGSVSTEGDEIHLKLIDKVLFATGEDQLSDKGKQVLDKVAVALKEIPDKQIWVQGHTDDQPIYLRPKEDKKPEPKPVKGKPAPAPGPKAAAAEKLPEALRYMTNWELSAARALEVVHYLQDTAKIEPTRLAALAFGQYRPVSRSNKALNRRIEIVLYPKRAVLRK